MGTTEAFAWSVRVARLGSHREELGPDAHPVHSPNPSQPPSTGLGKLRNGASEMPPCCSLCEDLFPCLLPADLGWRELGLCPRKPLALRRSIHLELSQAMFPFPQPHPFQNEGESRDFSCPPSSV